MSSFWGTVSAAADSRPSFFFPDVARRTEETAASAACARFKGQTRLTFSIILIIIRTFLYPFIVTPSRTTPKVKSLTMNTVAGRDDFDQISARDLDGWDFACW